jgi:hypothetical protein
MSRVDWDRRHPAAALGGFGPDPARNADSALSRISVNPSKPDRKQKGFIIVTQPNMPPPSDPTPGFYPDGQGALRLWDGHRWTTLTRPMPQPQPQADPPPPQPPKKEGWFKRYWKFAIVLSILVIAGCGSLFGLIDPSTTGETTPSPAAVSDIENVASDSTEPEPEPTQETVKVGEKVRDDGYQFTVTKVTCGVSRVGDQYLGEKAQGKFCLVKLQVKNVGNEPIYFSDENQALVDTKGKTYSPDDEAWIYVDDSDPFGEINPGNTLKTTVPFDVSKRAKPDYMLLKAGVWGFSDGVRVKL